MERSLVSSYNLYQDSGLKLIRTMEYMQLKQWLPLTLESYDVLILKWLVDASYAMHNDFLSHTGATLSLGKGYPYSKSSKQKLNTKSYTEADLVGLGDMMTMIICTIYFMEDQRYHISDNIVNQDNQSTMLLSRNGKASSGKRTKHINIRYLFGPGLNTALVVLGPGLILSCPRTTSG